MEKIGEIIKKLRISRNISQPELAEMLGISPSMMGMIEQGRRKPSDDAKLKICEIFNVSMDYLMGRTTMKNPTREIEMQLSKLNLSSNEYDTLLNKWVVEQKIDNLNFDEPNSIIFKAYMDYLSQKTMDSNASIEEMKQNTNTIDNDFINMLKLLNKNYIVSYNYSRPVDSNVFPTPDTVVEIPVVGKISAGMPLLAVENIVSYAYAPSSQVKQGYTYFYLTVQGDSMNLKFHEGDIILVQKQSDLENDEIGVILINGEATVKKYKNENGLIILQPMSTNPEHQVQIYNPKEKDIEIIGKVISYQGKV
mgnify:FL=1